MAQNNFNVNDELLKLVQQQAQPQRQPVLNTGLLSGTQQNFGDVLRNPDQAQVNAGIAGVAALLSGRDAGRALVNSASAFGNTRQQTYENQLDANKIERESLRDRISGITSLAGVRSDDRNFAIKTKEENRAAIDFKNKNNLVKPTQFEDANGKLITLYENITTGLWENEDSEVVDPSAKNLIPHTTSNDSQAYLSKFKDKNLKDATVLEDIKKDAILNGDSDTLRSVSSFSDQLVAQDLGVDIAELGKTISVIDPNDQANRLAYQNMRQLSIFTAKEQEGPATAALQDRFLSSIAPGAVKAKSELERLRMSKSFPERINNTFSMIIEGRNSELTVKQYDDVANVMQNYYENIFNNNANAIEAVSGSQNKKFAEAYRNIIKSITKKATNQTTNTGSFTPADQERLKLLEAEELAEENRVRGLQ
jgi:hypothetical protein